MDHVTPATVSAAIMSAPAFARLGLSMRDANTRERAADALAVAIIEHGVIAGASYLDQRCYGGWLFPDR